MFNYYSIAAVVAATVVSMVFLSGPASSTDPDGTARSYEHTDTFRCGPTATQLQQFRCMQVAQFESE